MKNKAKVVYVFGGVYSSLGKGVLTSSIAKIFSNLGHRVSIMKFDPYLNLNPGALSPLQHGEVFITKDGCQCDLDLGNYERFLDLHLTKLSTTTAGKIYNEVINDKRNYVGKTVQVVPHITNKIKEKIYKIIEVEKPEFLFIEIGGTVGDIESIPFVEALSQIMNEYGRQNVLPILCSPIIKVISGEQKTKPTQHAINTISKLGIPPQAIVLRCDNDTEIEKETIEKLSLLCHVDKNGIFLSPNLESIYYLPNVLYLQNVHKYLYKYFQLPVKTHSKKMEDWITALEKTKKIAQKTDLYIVGEFTDLHDSYISIIESLRFACWKNGTKSNLIWIAVNQINKKTINHVFAKANGIILPSGDTSIGIDEKILVAQYARENNIPLLAIDSGMQILLMEYAKNVLKINNKLIGFNENASQDALFLHLHEGQRVGEESCLINDPKSMIGNIYQKKEIKQRHMHCFIFNRQYLDLFVKNGWKFPMISNDKQQIIEAIELNKKKFFIGVQYHPEFLSRPTNPEPLFDVFITKVIKK